eukprot:4749381-Alexandrium_andersonii.AAC.1
MTVNVRPPPTCDYTAAWAVRYRWRAQVARSTHACNGHEPARLRICLRITTPWTLAEEASEEVTV